jgi:hypothetical protein
MFPHQAHARLLALRPLARLQRAAIAAWLTRGTGCSALALM